MTPDVPCPQFRPSASILTNIAGSGKQILNKRLGSGTNSIDVKARMKFKIRTLMLVIAAVAVLLVALRFFQGGLLVVCLLVSCLAVARGLWLGARPFRRVSALGFLIAAIVTNATCLFVSVAFSGIVGTLITALASNVGIPITFGFGAAWCTVPQRKPPLTARSRVRRWATTLFFSVAPLTMLLTQWPFRLAFLASQPSLERLADRVGAGNPVTAPEWAGAFRIVGSDVNRVTGGVGLVTNPDPSGRSGFERRGPTPPGNGPFYNLSFDVQLTEKWRYVTED